MTERVCLERIQVGDYVCCIPQTRAHMHHVVSPNFLKAKVSKAHAHDPIQVLRREGSTGPGLRFVCPSQQAFSKPEVIFHVPFIDISAVDIKIEGWDSSRMLFIPASAVVASNASEQAHSSSSSSSSGGSSLNTMVRQVELSTLVTPMIALLIETLHPPTVVLDSRTTSPQRDRVQGFLIRAHLDMRSLPALLNLIEGVQSYQASNIAETSVASPHLTGGCLRRWHERRRVHHRVLELGLPGYAHFLPWIPHVGSVVRRLYSPGLRRGLEFIATFKGHLMLTVAVIQLYQSSSHFRQILQPPLDLMFSHCAPVYNLLQRVVVEPLVEAASAVWVSLPLIYVVTLNQCVTALQPALVSARLAYSYLRAAILPIVSQAQQYIRSLWRAGQSLGNALREFGSSRVGRSLLSMAVSVEVNEGEMTKKHLPVWATFTKYVIPAFKHIGNLLKPKKRPVMSRLPSTVDAISHLAQKQQRKLDQGESPSFSISFDSREPIERSKKSPSSKRRRFDRKTSPLSETFLSPAQKSPSATFFGTSLSPLYHSDVSQSPLSDLQVCPPTTPSVLSPIIDPHSSSIDSSPAFPILSFTPSTTATPLISTTMLLSPSIPLSVAPLALIDSEEIVVTGEPDKSSKIDEGLNKRRKRLTSPLVNPSVSPRKTRSSSKKVISAVPRKIEFLPSLLSSSLRKRKTNTGPSPIPKKLKSSSKKQVYLSQA